MVEKFGRVVERYGQKPVILRFSPSDVLLGVEFYEFPVDVPPVIETVATGQTLYREVWEQRGWTVEYV